ncbi:TPA: NUDIX domain-containing protein [Pseudomonas aeruginosa]|nr:NUDIX domain-containing protein [Pseudomonas aeruginosa]
MATPQVGVGVLVMRGGRVLLGRRKGSHGAGSWSAPGGHLEFGETPEDCARREALEETGLALSDLRHGPFSNDLFEGRHYLTVFILAACAEDAQAQVMEPDKCEGWAWFDWDDLPQQLFAPLASLCQRGYSPFAAGR